jgi:hypothetical protein
VHNDRTGTASSAHAVDLREHGLESLDAVVSWGVNRVGYERGQNVYRDALVSNTGTTRISKGNTLVLTLHSLWGAVAHLYTLGQRARTLDHTVYVGPRARAGSAAFAAQSR